MLTCKDFLRELNDYLDESCNPGLRSEIERHLNDCPNCFVVCDTTKKTVKVFRGSEPQTVPASLHDRLMRAIEKRCAGKRGDC